MVYQHVHQFSKVNPGLTFHLQLLQPRLGLREKLLDFPTQIRKEPIRIYINLTAFLVVKLRIKLDLPQIKQHRGDLPVVAMLQPRAYLIVYVHVCVCVHLHVCVCVHLQPLYVCVYTCSHCMCVCTPACMCVCTPAATRNCHNFNTDSNK